MRRCQRWAWAGATLFFMMTLPAHVGAQQLWRLQPTPQVSIGDGPGDGHELYQVADATVAPDGRILLLDGGSHTVRSYGPQGRLLKSVGGKGDGPGEYQSLRTLRLLASGDLLVYDLVSQRGDPTHAGPGSRPYDPGGTRPRRHHPRPEPPASLGQRRRPPCRRGHRGA